MLEGDRSMGLFTDKAATFSNPVHTSDTNHTNGDVLDWHGYWNDVHEVPSREPALPVRLPQGEEFVSEHGGNGALRVLMNSAGYDSQVSQGAYSQNERLGK